MLLVPFGLLLGSLRRIGRVLMGVVGSTLGGCLGILAFAAACGFRVSEELAAALSRWAGEEGVQRSDLIRSILTEAVEARQEGRASFQRPQMREPADLARLVTMLDAQTTELERVLRQNAKRDGELSKRAQDGRSHA